MTHEAWGMCGFKAFRGAHVLCSLGGHRAEPQWGVYTYFLEDWTAGRASVSVLAATRVTNGPGFSTARKTDTITDAIRGTLSFSILAKSHACPINGGAFGYSSLDGLLIVIDARHMD